MAVKTKRAVVSRKVRGQQILDASRWEKFLIASGTPYENLSESWLAFFDGQAEISTASVELVKLIDAAIKADNVLKELPL